MTDFNLAFMIQVYCIVGRIQEVACAVFHTHCPLLTNGMPLLVEVVDYSCRTQVLKRGYNSVYLLHLWHMPFDGEVQTHGSLT